MTDLLQSAATLELGTQVLTVWVCCSVQWISRRTGVPPQDLYNKNC